MVAVRPADPEEAATVLALLDGAALQTDAESLEAAISEGDVLVATPADADRILGALVLDGTAVRNVAVRPRRRDQAIGTALLEAAAADRDRLEARFNADLRPFYASLGFTIEPVAPDDPTSDRLHGVRES